LMKVMPDAEVDVVEGNIFLMIEFKARQEKR
jgi:hypothetical protein